MLIVYFAFCHDTTHHTTLQIVVSHDQYFLSKAVSSFWAVSNRTVTHYLDLEKAKAHSF